jgi:hypothetical protein
MILEAGRRHRIDLLPVPTPTQAHRAVLEPFRRRGVPRSVHTPPQWPMASPFPSRLPRWPVTLPTPTELPCALGDIVTQGAGSGDVG